MTDDFRGKVAVVTGAASGLGFGLAERLVDVGARVVLADVEEAALDAAVAELAGRGPVLAVPVDVSDPSSVEELRHRTEAAFGPAQLVFNNAGVGTTAPTDELPLSAWEWVVGVNLWGPIHGCRTFLPGMVERDEGHIVTTSSVTALRPFTVVPVVPYVAAKTGVVGLSGALHYDLRSQGSAVRVSVIPLGAVRTNIHSSHRNFLERFGEAPPTSGREALRPPPSGEDPRMHPRDAADQVLAGVREGRFWIWAGWYPEPPEQLFASPRLPPFDAGMDGAVDEP